MTRAAFLNLNEKQLMALTIYREASGEPPEGKIAVGTVILERVDHRNWDGKTVNEVCLWPRQFSCFDETDKGFGKTLHTAETWALCIDTDFSLMDSYTVAVGMLTGIIPRNPILAAAHCCQYLNPTRAPETRARWIAKGMTSLLVIKNHEFFDDRGVK